MSTTSSERLDTYGAVEPDLSSNAVAVLENRYLVRDDDGRVIETPTELFRRVARTITAPEERWGTSSEERERIEREFYQLMATKAFLPNSPTLMNADRRLGMLSACFVLPLGDSIPANHGHGSADGPGPACRRAAPALICLKLRPKGSIVRSSGGTTDGPLSFLKMLSGVTEAIQQGAFRRGANMGIMRVDHPDIMGFIDLKSDLTQLANYNLSVAMTDTFMESLTANPDRPHAVLKSAHRPNWRALKAEWCRGIR